MAKPLQQEETIEMNESTFESISSYGSLSSHEIVQRTESETATKTAEPITEVSRGYRQAVFCLVLLCVLLLAAIGVFWIHFNKLSEETEQLETRTNELRLSRDQFSYNNLTLSRDELQTRFSVTEKIMNYTGWIYFKSSLYDVSTARKTWTEGRNDCREKGADLVIISTKEERNFISHWSRSMEIWIGLSKGQTDGSWRWVDGTELTTPFWGPGEPRLKENYECVAKVLDSETSWINSLCDVEYFYICEKNILS